jgi:CheY-like chemotaxis protein
MKKGTVEVSLLKDLKFSVFGSSQMARDNNDPNLVSNRAQGGAVDQTRNKLLVDNSDDSLLLPEAVLPLPPPAKKGGFKGHGLTRKMTFLPSKKQDVVQIMDELDPPPKPSFFQAQNSPYTYHKSGCGGATSKDSNLEKKPRYKVLVANDDSFQLMIIMRVLHQFSEYFETIDQAENGMVAANLVANSKGGEEGEGAAKKPYNLIILDLDMPILNGYDACKQIRENDFVSNNGLYTLLRMDFKCNDYGENHNPSVSVLEGDNSFVKVRDNQPLIIALSAYLNQDIISRCEVAGFDDYLESPLTKDKILTRMIMPLEKKKERLQKCSNKDNELSENDDKEDSIDMQNQFEGMEHAIMPIGATPAHPIPGGD